MPLTKEQRSAAAKKAAATRKRNQAKSAEILVKYAQIDPSIVASMVRAAYGVALTTQLVQPVIDVTAKYLNFAPFPARDIIDAPGPVAESALAPCVVV